MSFAPTAPSEATVEAGGHVKGVTTAIVSDNKDSSGLGRVRVKFPWLDTGESYWARVAMPMAGKNRGIYFIPEIDDEVLVAFDRGDLRFPYVVGTLWNGKDKSPSNNGDGKNDVRLIQTRKGHKLTFDDGNKGRVQVELNDGKKLLIDDDGIKVDDGSGNSLVIDSRGGGITIKATSKLELQAAQIVIKASASLDVSSGGNLKLSGTPVNIN
jgi:uncharacterized protein involved in type VI secretion and phage assembly